MGVKETYLTVKQLAEIKGCTERYIRNCITKGKMEAIQKTGLSTGQGGMEYRIPLSKLDEKVQLKYKRYLKKQQKEVEKQVQEQQNKTIADLTEKEKQNVMFWRKLLESWQSYRGKEADKEKADNEFIKVMNVQNEGLHLSRRTLYRKWNTYIMEGEAALADGRGKHGNHNYKMTKEIFDVFEYYYLNENKPSIKQCMRETELYFEGQEIELPCYSTFKRSVEKIPKAIKMYFREREKVFIDKCAPYIKRMYEDLESNDIWVADNHTFDIMVEKEGKPARVYLTAFMDVRSRKMMGWCVTDAPSSDATIYALKKGCEKFGVPRSIYTDNGREFLFHDLGGNGFRKKRKNGEELKLPSILDDLGIEFRTALPRNARGKGIERAFYTVKEHFSKLFESYTGGTILERPDRLKKIVKTMKGLPSIEEFIQYVDIYIEGWYNKQPHEGTGMKGKCPDEVFAENMITKRVLPKEKADLMFMRYAKSNTGMLKVGKNGITLTFYGKQLQYWNEELWKEYFGQNVYVRYNPEDLSNIRIYDEQKRFLCIAALKEELSYTASKQEVKKQQQQNRNAIKEVANYKAKKEMEQKDALTMLLEKALKEESQNKTVIPKITQPVFYNENQIKNTDDTAEVVALPNVAGGEGIDWSKGIERLKKVKELENNLF